jgi:hypothetical protein
MRGRWEESVEVEEAIGRVNSSRCRDLAGSLKPADGHASPTIRHASVDEARLDVSMTEVILHEVDRLAGVEEGLSKAKPKNVVSAERAKAAWGGCLRAAPTAPLCILAGMGALLGQSLLSLRSR